MKLRKIFKHETILRTLRPDWHTCWP